MRAGGPDRPTMSDTHGSAAGHTSEATHGSVPAHDGDEFSLGPTDWTAWAAGILGVALGVIVWFCLILATS